MRAPPGRRRGRGPPPPGRRSPKVLSFGSSSSPPRLGLGISVLLLVLGLLLFLLLGLLLLVLLGLVAGAVEARRRRRALGGGLLGGPVAGFRPRAGLGGHRVLGAEAAAEAGVIDGLQLVLGLADQLLAGAEQDVVAPRRGIAE